MRRIFEIVGPTSSGREHHRPVARPHRHGVAATNLLKTSEFEERLAALEAAQPRGDDAGVSGSSAAASWAGPTDDPGASAGELEASRTPTEIVLAWLAEVQAYPTLPEYVASLGDAPKEAWPLGASPRRSRRPCGPRSRASPRRSGRRCADQSATPSSSSSSSCSSTSWPAIADFEGLRWALLAKWLGLLSAEAELAERTGLGDPAHAAREAQDWRDVLVLSLTSLYTEQAARASLERRTSGPAVLFPELAREWADLVERLEWLAEHAQALPALHTDGSPVCLDELRRQAGESADARARELTLIARVEALEKLGEHERVAAIMERQVRALAAPASPVP